MVVSCQFSDCADCSKKTGTLEGILRHQVDCKACDQCQYLCPIKDRADCNCKEYYTKTQLVQHLNFIRLKKLGIEEKENEMKRRQELNNSSSRDAGEVIPNQQPQPPNNNNGEFVNQNIENG